NKGTLADKGIQQITLQAIYQVIEQKIQSSRGYRTKEKALIDQVRKFFKEKELPLELCEELVEELEARMSYKSNVDYIYIRPKAGDYDMFSYPHFSLQRNKTEKIVRTGFMAGIAGLRGLRLDKFGEHSNPA